MAVQILEAPVFSEEEALSAKKEIEEIIANIETVIIGKHDKIELIIMSLLAEGHVLIEDIPGVGKTSLVSALAKTIDLDYKRIQFTPDVMPSDISGFSIFNQKTSEFEFRPGAAMSNIVLADEINRASAKTQSAMLEIMEERQITVDLNTYKLPAPFMVLATQNPIESLGTYRLPEAQIDRFMIKLSLGYPEFENEIDIVLGSKQAKKEINYVVKGEDVVKLINLADKVYVSRQVVSYVVQIVTSTRSHPDVKLGSSPRGSLALFQLAKAYALYQGRNYVKPEDIKYLAPFVLAHRLMLSNAAKTEKRTAENVIKDILDTVVVPTGV